MISIGRVVAAVEIVVEDVEVDVVVGVKPESSDAYNSAGVPM